MNPCKILAVFLISVLAIRCGTAASRTNEAEDHNANSTRYIAGDFLLGRVLSISSDGYVLFELADDKTNRIYSGKKVRVSISRIYTKTDSDLTGTFIRVDGREDGNGAYFTYDARLGVRTEEQNKKWVDFLTEQKNLIYGPRDVYPPAISR